MAFRPEDIDKWREPKLPEDHLTNAKCEFQIGSEQGSHDDACRHYLRSIAESNIGILELLMNKR